VTCGEDPPFPLAILRGVDLDVLLFGGQQQQQYEPSETRHDGLFGRQLIANTGDESFVLNHIQTLFQRMLKQSVLFLMDDMDRNNETGKNNQCFVYSLFLPQQPLHVLLCFHCNFYLKL
jgi:hypothetical protein